MRSLLAIVQAGVIFARGRSSLGQWNIQFFLCALIALYGGRVMAGYSFDPGFLADTQFDVADLSVFQADDSMLPGIYYVDVYMNGRLIDTRDVQFVSSSTEHGRDAGTITACFKAQELTEFNINLILSSALVKGQSNDCVSLESTIAGAKSTLNFEKQRLDLSVPQIMLLKKAQGTVPVDRWDEGINALLFNYTFHGANRWGQGASDSYFLGLNSGVNVEAWRFKNYSTFTYDQSRQAGARGKPHWNNISNYAQRSLNELKSKLIIGEASTGSNIFDGFGFQGVQIMSDDTMLADSERGFAPIVRGMASSNAEVTIRQNGYVIYQTFVAAGAFQIDDLYPTSTNGDLVVSVTEADGRVNMFTVPFSAVPVLQREGRFKYELTMGKLRTNDHQRAPEFMLGTLIWGGPFGMTLYTGGQQSQGYTAGLVGIGQNLGGWGGMSFDLTHATSKLVDKSEHRGHALRALYEKTFAVTGTNLRMSAYHYSSTGFYTLSDTALRRRPHTAFLQHLGEELAVGSVFSNYFDISFNDIKRDRLQLNMSQSINSISSLSLTANRETFWNNTKTDDRVDVYYQLLHGQVNYSLTYSYGRSMWRQAPDQRLGLSVSMPLGDWRRTRFSPGADTNLMYGRYEQNVNSDGVQRFNTSVNGTMLKNRLGYGFQQGYNNQNHMVESSLNANYRSPLLNSSATYSDSPHRRQLYYGLSGGMVVHDNGLTLSQPLGDTNVLISAPGAQGAAIPYRAGLETDSRGYAVMSSASAYRENRVEININSLSNNIELDDAVVHVVPTQGALVKADFKVRIGARVLIYLTFGGKAVPFGAVVTQVGSNTEGMVGDFGQVYMTGLEPTGLLEVRWQAGTEAQCQVRYQLPAGSEFKEFTKLSLECVQ